jgi:hypothetical protein
MNCEKHSAEMYLVDSGCAWLCDECVAERKTNWWGALEASGQTTAESELPPSAPDENEEDEEQHG